MKKTQTFEALILTHRPLVLNLAAKLNFSHDEEREKDLVSVGEEALCFAALRYDPNRQADFATYAYSCVRGSMLNEINASQNDALVSEDETRMSLVPNTDDETWLQVDHLLRESNLTEREQRVVRMKFGIDCPALNTQDIADEYGLTVQMINLIKRSAFEKMRLAA